jgi:hypothetical protein
MKSFFFKISDIVVWKGVIAEYSLILNLIHEEDFLEIELRLAT